MTSTRTGAATKSLRRSAALAATALVFAGTAVGQAHAAPAPQQSGGAAKTSASYPKWAYASSSVNVRQWATTGSKAIGSIPKGGHVGVISTNTAKGWVKVNYKGTPGYVSTSYVKIGPAGQKPSGGSGSGSGAVSTCQASHYNEGSQTANGERFNPSAMTAAHKTYKFGTKLKVTNKANGKSVVVRINDRGPYVSGRCLDLSTGAFSKIASTGAGVATVNYQVVG